MSVPRAAGAGVAALLAERCGGAVVESFGDLTVDVPSTRWIEALVVARDDLGLCFFDWLSAVDELEAGFSVVAHLAATGVQPTQPPGPARLVHLLLRTSVPLAAPALPTATAVFPGAGWHERETWEMFGIDFEGHPNLVPLLLPDGFVGRPLRKQFELSARLARPWPGAKEPARARAEP